MAHALSLKKYHFLNHELGRVAPSIGEGDISYQTEEE